MREKKRVEDEEQPKQKTGNRMEISPSTGRRKRDRAIGMNGEEEGPES